MENKKDRIYTSTVVIFWMTVVLFIMTILNIFVMDSIDLFNRYVFFSSAVALSCSGIALIVLAFKARITRISRAFFILTGASAFGMVISSVLHNLIYALLTVLFGEGLWTSMGDEPVFFILATVICPLALLVGMTGGIVMIARKKVLA